MVGHAEPGLAVSGRISRLPMVGVSTGECGARLAGAPERMRPFAIASRIRRAASRMLVGGYSDGHAREAMSTANPESSAPSLESEQRAHEPSMEEILASIRRIIADDDALPLMRRPSLVTREPAAPPAESVSEFPRPPAAPAAP